MAVSAFFLFPFVGLSFVMYFLPLHRCLRPQQARYGLDCASELLPRVDNDWVGRCPGLGTQGRCPSNGALRLPLSCSLSV